MRYPLGASTLLCSLMLSCGSSSDPAPVDEGLDRSAVLASITGNVIAPTHDALLTRTTALSAATAQWSNAPSEETRTAAQVAFRQAFAVLQQAELMQVGPAGAASKFRGGQGIRDELYSWPATNPCRVDQELVEEGYANASFFENELVNVYGFDALEYLLFVDGEGNACPQPTPINRDGTWAALGAETVTARRAAYGHAIAQQLVADVTQLSDAWAQGFATELSQAGRSGTVYPTAQAGLDDVFASMFYIDRQLKDTKLGTPLGITPECRNESCPELLESRFSDTNAENLQANIESFALMYYGGDKDDADAYGFDDLLRESNATDLADNLDTRIAAMLAQAEILEDPMGPALASTSDNPRALYDAVKGVTDLFKSQFVSVLNLRVPQEGAADND